MRGAPLLLAVLAAALTLGTGQAAADYRFAYRHWIDAGSTMTTTDAGLQRGCLNDPEPCRAIGRAGVTATPALMGLLSRVNLAVNATLPLDGPRSNSQRAGTPDGEPAARAKRNRLIALGLAPSALRLVHLATAAGHVHDVLIVRTDGPQLVLDSSTTDILPIADRTL